MTPRLVSVLLIAAAVAHGQPASGSITGTVVDQWGAVIPGAVVTIESPMPMAGATTDALGRFIINGVPPGTYSLVIQQAGFRPRELEIQVEDANVTLEGRVMLDLAPLPPCLDRMNPPVFHETTLPASTAPPLVGSTRILPDGALRGWSIILRGPGKSHEITTTTDNDGRFEFHDVPPGTYEIVIGEWPTVHNVRVRKGHQLEVHLTWTPGQLCL